MKQLKLPSINGSLMIDIDYFAAELKKLYPVTTCFLHYKTDYQLLIAIMLSAQTTDIKVNAATDILFSLYPTLDALSTAPIEEVKRIITPLGLGNIKSNNLLAIAKILLEYQCVPHDFNLLILLPGVGEKTARVFLAEYLNLQYFPVDTHIKRVINRLGISLQDDPNKISKTLETQFANYTMINLHRQIILFGRNICHSRSPRCQHCPFSQQCLYLRIK